jgi:hypothetical protein
VSIYIEVAGALGKAGQFEKSIAMALRGLACFGLVTKGAELPSTDSNGFQVEKWGVAHDDGLQAWFCLCRAYKQCAPHLLGKVEEYAKLMYMMCVGEDVNFGETYERVMGL